MSSLFAVLAFVAFAALATTLVGFAVFVWLQVFEALADYRKHKKWRDESRFQ
jgi:cytochrome c1